MRGVRASEVRRVKMASAKMPSQAKYHCDVCQVAVFLVNSKTQGSQFESKIYSIHLSPIALFQ